MPSERCHICWNLDRYCICDDLRHEADYVSDERMELTLEEAHGMGMDLETMIIEGGWPSDQSDADKISKFFVGVEIGDTVRRGEMAEAMLLLEKPSLSPADLFEEEDE